MIRRNDVTPEATAEAYLRLGRSERAAARELGLSRGAIKYRLDRARAMGWELSLPISGGKLTAFQTITMPLPRCGEVKRYILTSIQNNTFAHTAFFENVVAYGEHIGADIKVARYSYNRASYGNNATKANKGPTDDDRKDNFYDPIFEEYICDDRLELAPFLIFAGEMNIIPTASNPLSGLETYGGLQSAIFPHSKLALQSIPGTCEDGTKFNYTTGTATLLNYIQKKEGLKAEFHHAYGALIVEVDHEGDWFVRQLNADTDGTFYDITLDGVVRVCDGEVGAGSVEAITWGDIHADVVQHDVFSLAFDDNGILDTLRPVQQFVHDILDFRARNHHEIKNPHRMFKRYIEQTDNVREEVKRARDTLHYMDRDWCQMFVVDSNHDNALERWMREADYRFDPVNAIFFLECQLDKYRAIEDEDEHYHVLQAAMQRLDVNNDIHFLGPDDSYVICPDKGGGIECAMHGHLGPNGSQGSALGLARMGRRANTAHTHSATIKDGMYVAGTMSRLRLDWNDGPSSWSHSFIVTYENGKRTIVTCYNGKWRAGS